MSTRVFSANPSLSRFFHPSQPFISTLHFHSDPSAAEELRLEPANKPL